MTALRSLLLAATGLCLASSSSWAQADLAARVRASFGSCELADASSVTVSARDGVVTLGGHVRTLRERECVAVAAERVSGVRFLEPRTGVRPAVQVGDEQLADLVRRRLRESDDFQGPAPLQADVAKGRVTLSGEVRVPDDKYLAEQVLREIEGVTDFDNQVTVDPQRGLHSMEVQLLELFRVNRVPVEGLRFLEEEGRVIVAGRSHDVVAKRLVDDYVNTLPGGNLVTKRLHVVLGAARDGSSGS